MTNVAQRIQVKGRVQGVGYRAWTVRQAAGLSLGGWVRNRRDGSVEILVFGCQENIGVLVDACRRGPAGAEVSDITIATEDYNAVADGIDFYFTERPSE